MEKLNTHYYDGKLKSNKFNSISTKDIKEVEFNKLITFIQKDQTCNVNIRITAIRAVQLIKNSIGKSPNYDSTNEIYADDILFHICKKFHNDILTYLIEQLSDIITSGQCPQGRVIRLIQVFACLDDIVS